MSKTARGSSSVGSPGSVQNSWITGSLTWTTATENTNLLHLTDDRYAKPARYILLNYTLRSGPWCCRPSLQSAFGADEHNAIVL
jgi:hypothetical protein